MRRATIHNSASKGVLGVGVSERIDLVHYYSGLRVGTNCATRPQGGWLRRPGTMLADGMDLISSGVKRRLRRRLEPVNLTSGMITVANGGTAANLVDQALSTDFTTNSVSGATFVMAEIDLGSAQAIAAVDVEQFRCASAGADDALAVEWSDGSNWFAFDGRRNIRTTRRTRRFSSPPGGPGGTMVSTRYLRVVLYGATGTGAFSIARVRVWKEKRTVSPSRVIMFARAADTKYELVLTDRNIDVFRNHRWVSAIPVPVDASQVRRMTKAQSLDTLVMYHEDVETPVITRMGEHDEWDYAPLVFTNQPTLSPATSFSADTNEVQELTIAGLVNGQSFVLWVDNEVTAPISFSGTGTLASSIASALSALPAFATNSPTVTLVDATTRRVRILFSGSLGARRWAPVFAVVLADDVIAPTTEIIQRGIDADGAFISKQTGFPRCGLFNQSRHFLGGFRSAPQSIVASKTGTLSDLQTTSTPMTADLAFIDTLDTDQNETIYQMIVGKHLQAMTESGVWFMEARTLDALQPRNWRLATRPGIDPAVPVQYLDDATLYMQAGERRPGVARGPSRVMRDLVLISNVEATYAADPKNALAPELITDAVDFAAGEPRTADDPARGFVVNSDGTIAHLGVQRAQEVVSFFPWTTPGSFRSVGVDMVGNIWGVVERSTSDGSTDNYLERFDATTPLDAVTVHAFEVATATITGLGHHEGKSVWAYADKDLYGPYTVTGAQIVLDVPAYDVSVGLMSEWEVEPMPIREKLNEAQPFRPPGRIYELEVTVRNTGLFDVSVNGGPAQEATITFFGEHLADGGPFQQGGEMDLPLLDRLFTGPVKLDKGMLGFSKHPRWRLSQSKPAPIEVLSVRAELAYRG